MLTHGPVDRMPVTTKARCELTPRRCFSLAQTNVANAERVADPHVAVIMVKAAIQQLKQGLAILIENSQYAYEKSPPVFPG